jgi:hypothetical protein
MNSLRPSDEKPAIDTALSTLTQDRAELTPLTFKKTAFGSFARLRQAGEKLTGGGIRALGRRLFLNFVRRSMAMVMRRPRLLAFAHTMMKRYPRVSWRLNRLAEIADPYAGRVYVPAGRLSDQVDATAMTLPASARIIYLRLRAAGIDNDSGNPL